MAVIRDMARIFTKGVWRTFGARLISLLYSNASFRYDFGLGKRDVREVCTYWDDTSIGGNAHIIALWLNEHQLVDKENRHWKTVKNIMEFVNTTYPSLYYYERDGARDTWNTPLQTLDSWLGRSQLVADGKAKLVYWEFQSSKEWREFSTTDCDDYAIFFYNAFRIAGVPKEQLRLCFMQTSGEWHMNVMFFHDNVPYAVEGTFFPSVAQGNFLKVPYFENSVLNGGKRNYYYYGVRWLWNEDEVRYNAG